MEESEMRTRHLLAIVFLVGCTNESVEEQPAQQWDTTLATFVDAACRWDWDCSYEHNQEADCVERGTSNMNTIVRPQLQPDQESRCVTCMQAWIDVYVTVTSPCRQELTFDENQKITAACTEDMSCVSAFRSP
jgi:hypothetical protein